ncbi:HNH endonuclease signature motif containing protein [Arthrobacter sp. U41]|uniref:HNH endonuclease signature motif containing protein n=1 Tax=Arthrobacter sp. U41 TaxID=1849032 RepID=UPI0009F73F7F|nr:HNH endonuclease signature motif containing protein [Arthrobacter sp. U41]
MECTDWCAEGRAALAAVAAWTAALDSVPAAGADADPAGPPGADQTGPPGAVQTGPSGAVLTGSSGVDPLWEDPLRDLAGDCLDGLTVMARWEARAAALKVRLAATYLQAADALAPPAVALHDNMGQEMAVTAEIACALTVSEQTAGAFLGDCLALTKTLPLTLAALTAGTISWAHARIMVDETTSLDPAGAAALEAHFLDPAAPNPARGCPAGELVPGRFRAKARTWRERHHRESIEQRHARCAADRRVEFRPDTDGMAWFSAYLPADTAAGIWERTTAAARALQGPDEERTLTQLRADIAATWLLTTGATSNNGTTGAGGEGAVCGDAVGGGVPSPRAQVLITVPVLSLLGAGQEPAMLDGYGPIPPSMARRLITDGAGSFHRVLIDPRDGAPLEIGRTSYRLTKAQRHWLMLRDGRCPFPGCNNHSLDNEADHLLAWADGGTTGITNLGQPCRKHHKLKHNSAWTPAGASKTAPPGWTSPSGRNYPSEQQDWEPPHWPDDWPDSGSESDTGTATGMDLDALMGMDPPPGVDPDLDFDTGLPPDPGPNPEQEQELPADPFPDWYLSTAGQPSPTADTAAPNWPETLNDPLRKAS